MAKTLKRLSVDELNKHIGQELHFVLNNNSVMMARLIAAFSEGWKIQNSKGHTLHLLSHQISEIWLDQKATQ